MKNVALIIVLLVHMGLFSQDAFHMPDTLTPNEKPQWLLNNAKKNYTSDFQLADSYSKAALLLAVELQMDYEAGLANKYLGITDYFRHDYNAALIHYNEALDLFEKIGELKEQANVTNNIALIYMETRDYTTAISYYKESLEIREKINDASGIIGSLTNIGNLYQYQDQHDKSIEYYLEALNIAITVFPENPLSTTLGSLAKSYWKTGQIDKAIYYFDEAIRDANNNKNYVSLVSSLTNKANLYNNIGSGDKAIATMIEALKIAQEHSYAYEEAAIKNNIGNLLFYNENITEALDYYKQALNGYEATNSDEGAIHSLINIALCYNNFDSTFQALDYLKEANSIANDLGDDKFIALTSIYLGKQYLRLDINDSSLYHLTSAYKLSEAKGFRDEIYKSNYNLGEYWMANDDLKLALSYYIQAFEVALEMKSVRLEKDAMEGMWKGYAALGSFENAFNTLVEYNILNDSIFNEEKQKQINEIERKLNFELKENQIISQEEIIAHQKENLIQEKQIRIYIIVVAVLIIITVILLFRQQKIRRQKEKAELIQQNLTVEHDLLQLQMNPHFIFNALNSIQSFISENDSYQAELFLSRFANLMRYYLDSSSKKWVGFNEEINALKTNLELERLRMNKSFDFDIEVPYNMDVDEIEIPPMLMQPFIENSVKHGFRNKGSKGQLDIGFELIADVLICTITDNGIGREKAAEFSKKSKDHQSKGVKLTNERLEKHNRKKGKNYFIRIVDIYDDNNKPAGTKVIIRLPVQYA